MTMRYTKDVLAFALLIVGAVSTRSTNGTTCEVSTFCVDKQSFDSCTGKDRYSTSQGCCPCQLRLQSFDKDGIKCLLNTNTELAVVLYICSVLIAMALLRMYVATAVREGKEEAEHAHDMSEYYKLYRVFGLQMQVDDYEQNAYDRNDLQFLRLHRILLTGQVIWVVNPLGLHRSLWKSATTTANTLTGSVNFFTDTSSWMSSCVMHGDGGTETPYIQLQASFWLLLTCTVFVLQIVMDMVFSCARVGCKHFGKVEQFRGDEDEASSHDPDTGKETRCQNRIGNVSKRAFRVFALVYLVVFPPCMCVFLQGFACNNDKVNAIDQSACGFGTSAFGFAFVALLLPIVGYTYLYCKIRRKDAVYDDKFLHDWGFMIIGYVSYMQDRLNDACTYS